MEQPFAFTTTADRSVRITWRGRTVTVLAGPAADRFLDRIAAAPDDEAAAQMLMAKATGQFKRGNEKTAKRSPKR